MKALVKAKAEIGIWMQDMPEPVCGQNDVKIKIKQTSICGTDVHIYQWDEWAQKTIPLPMIVGHEYMGEIVEVGSEVDTMQVGDRVSGEGHLICGQCRNCLGGKRHLCRNTVGVGVNRTGAFAEYLVIPAFNVFKLPAHVPDDIATIFDPLGNAVHTALSFDMVGEDVLITGAGPIGAMAAIVCLHAGARHVVITDMNDYRLNLAKSMSGPYLGTSREIHTVNISRDNLKQVVDSLGMKEGFDLGLEMSGSEVALQQMFDHMINGGKISLLGIPSKKVNLDLNAIIFKGLHIKGIYGREMFETWYKMAMLIDSNVDISPIITHRYNIDEFQKGFDVMLSGQAGKVILKW